MLKSFIDANENKEVRLYTDECCLGGCCEAPEGADQHYVTGLFLGLRYQKRFRCLAVVSKQHGVVVHVRLKNVVRVTALSDLPSGEEPNGRGDTT